MMALIFEKISVDLDIKYLIMKRYFFYFLCSWLFCLLLLSCKKTEKAADLLLGKWYIDSIQIRQNFGNGIIYITVNRFPSKIDYWDYRNDNKLYRFQRNYYDTLAYAVQTDANGQQYVQYNVYGADSIKLLTSTNLIFIDPQGSASKLFFTKQ